MIESNKKSVKKGFNRSHTKMVNKDLLKAKEQLNNINDDEDEDTKHTNNNHETNYQDIGIEINEFDIMENLSDSYESEINVKAKNSNFNLNAKSMKAERKDSTIKKTETSKIKR